MGLRVRGLGFGIQRSTEVYSRVSDTSEAKGLKHTSNLMPNRRKKPGRYL